MTRAERLAVSRLEDRLRRSEVLYGPAYFLAGMVFVLLLLR